MEKGGYQVVDLNDVNLTTTGTKVTGVYRRIKDNNRKVILLSGITINGTPLSDCFVKAIQMGTDFLLNVYGVILENELTQYDIFIEDDDTVTLQQKNVVGGSNPMTAQGDIIVGGEDGALTRLPIGEAGQVLMVNSEGTGLEYGTVTGGVAFATVEVSRRGYNMTVPTPFSVEIEEG